MKTPLRLALSLMLAAATIQAHARDHNGVTKSHLIADQAGAESTGAPLPGNEPTVPTPEDVGNTNVDSPPFPPTASIESNPDSASQRPNQSELRKESQFLTDFQKRSWQALPGKTAGASEQTYYRRGYGFKDANVFDPKYKERLKNLLEQVAMGEMKGWISGEQANYLRSERSRLAALESSIAARNYPKQELDDLEKQINFFNVTVSQALSKGVPVLAPAVSIPDAHPQGTVDTGQKNSTDGGVNAAAPPPKAILKKSVAPKITEAKRKISLATSRRRWHQRVHQGKKRQSVSSTSRHHKNHKPR